MTEQDLTDLEPGAVQRPWLSLLRLVALFVIVIVLPMLLVAATVHPDGCGGG